MIILDLFSGIGGFSEGFKRAGYKFEKHYYSEIDKHAIAVYKHKFKNSEYVGSVTTLDGKSIKRPNIITFGSPCQDFSLAGKRTGMGGERSSLIGEAIRLITECRPDVFIWENVKGAFSTNDGADFWGIIQAFANIGGYRLEWELCNTAWLLPQNRERIYLIGHLGEGGGQQVFPIGEEYFRINEGSEQTADIRTLSAGGNSGGMHSQMTLIRHRSTEPYLEGDIAPTLRNSDKAEVRIVAMRGRNPKNPTSRKPSLKTEQMLEQREDKNTNTLTSVQKDNLVIQSHSPRSGDPKKGGTGKLESDKHCFTVDSAPHYVKKDNYIQWDQSGKGHDSQQSRAFYEDGNMGCIPGGRTESKVNILTNNSIRRLTERECEKLQGFEPGWTEYGNYDGEVKKVAATQRYKLIGNAVTADIVEMIANKLNL